MAGMGINSHLMSRRRRSAESAVLRFWEGLGRGEKLTRDPVSERLPGISRLLSMSVPLSVVLMLRDRNEREGSCMCSERNGAERTGPL